MYAFHPQTVCAKIASRSKFTLAKEQHSWTRQECGDRRFLLPGLGVDVSGKPSYIKEHFFFGGGTANFERGWNSYRGVELPLCWWEQHYIQKMKKQPVDNKHAAIRRACIEHEDLPKGKRKVGSVVDVGNWKKSTSTDFDSSSSSVEFRRRKCINPTCYPIDINVTVTDPIIDKNKKPRFRLIPERNLPRVVPSLHPGATVPDFTVNYLCSPSTLQHLADSYGAPSHFRFILQVRSPNRQLRASYLMFVEWGWVKSNSLSEEVEKQLRELRKCNATLYDDPMLLGRIHDSEIIQYFNSCWDSRWSQFLKGSLPPFVCLRSWLARGFKLEQFMLVPQERLRKMKTYELLPQIANFTGLHYAPEIFNLIDRGQELRAKCQVDEARGPLINSHSSFSGKDGQKRAQLDEKTKSEYGRLANAYIKLFKGMNMRTIEGGGSAGGGGTFEGP